jgi:hypothetical protein
MPTYVLKLVKSEAYRVEDDVNLLTINLRTVIADMTQERIIELP